MDIKDLERLQNEHATRLTQQFNRLNAELKQVLDGLDGRIDESVQRHLKLHTEQIQHALGQISNKMEKHFGK